MQRLRVFSLAIRKTTEDEIHVLHSVAESGWASFVALEVVDFSVKTSNRVIYSDPLGDLLAE